MDDVLQDSLLFQAAGGKGFDHDSLALGISSLEVSGTGAESLEERHTEKVDQLLSNPYGVDGFVIVVRFASQEAWFTFHRVREQRVR